MIKIKYDAKTKYYLVPRINYSNVKVNGKDLGNRLSSSTYITTEKPLTITTTRVEKYKNSYKNRKTGEIITQKELDKLKNPNVFKDGEWLDVEAEIRYTLFKRNLEVVYKDKTVVKDLEFEIIEYPVPEFLDIKPLYEFQDFKDVSQGIYRFQPDFNFYFKNIAKDLKLKAIDTKQSNNFGYTTLDNGHYLEWAKVNGRSVFYDFGKRGFLRFADFKGTYEECCSTRLKLIKFIKDNIITSLDRTDPAKVTDVAKCKIFSSLMDISSNLECLDTSNNGLKYSILSDLEKLKGLVTYNKHNVL